MTIRTKQRLAALMAAILLAGTPGTLSAQELSQHASGQAAAKPGDEQLWLNEMETALTLAQSMFQPVLAVFTSSDCSWCSRLKSVSLKHPDVEALLQYFTLLELDVGSHAGIAASYGVNGVPTIAILSFDGSAQAVQPGYLPPQELKTFLEQSLNPDFSPPESQRDRQMLERLDRGNVPKDEWPRVMIAMGEKGMRVKIRELLFKWEEFPVKRLLSLLEDPRVAVRLGALELLEERVGDNFGFDPWLDLENEQSNREALAKFEQWRADKRQDGAVRYSAMTVEQIDAFVRDLISKDRQRSLRAKRMLEQGGTDAAHRLAEFLAENPQLPEGMLLRIKEVRYAIMLPKLLNMNPSAFAHRLLYGTLDLRLKCIAALRSMNEDALPILRDCLADDNPLVRETAVDALASIGGLKAAGTLKTHLQEETDKEVVFSVLSGLGAVRSKTGLEVLKEYSDHGDEDLAIAALNSIGRLKSKLAGDELEEALSDERWRVRVAALEAIKKIELGTLDDEVAELLDDPDDFVRFAAVKTLASLAPGKEELEMLEEAFLDDDKLKGPVIAAFGSLDKPLPDSFGPALKAKPPEILLSAIEGLSSCGKAGVELASEHIDHPNLDVACAAIRLVARYGMDLAEMQERIAEVLQSGGKKKIMAALESIRIGSEPMVFSRSMNVEIDLSDIVGSDLAASDDAEAVQESPGLEDLFGAFEQEPAEKDEDEADDGPAVAQEPAAMAGKAQNNGEQQSLDLDGLFSAFGAASEARSSQKETGEVVYRQKGVEGVIAEVERHFRLGDDPELRFAAASLLLKLGKSTPIDYLGQEYDKLTLERKLSIANSLEKVKDGEVHPLMLQLLDDDAGNVRRAALDSMLELAEEESDYLDVVFRLMRSESSKLDIEDFFSTHQWQYLTGRNDKATRIMRAQALEMLESDNLLEQNMGLIVLSKTWRSGDDENVKEFLGSDNQYQRRAAYFALGINDKGALIKHIDPLLSDPSEYVRLVLPYCYSRNRGWGGARWLHYLDGSTSTANYNISSSYGSSMVRLAEEPRQALIALSGDKSPRVRMEAFLSLLSNRVPIDLNELVRTVESFPDREAASERIGDYLANNYNELGPQFKVLLPYIDFSSRGSATTIKIREYFNVDETEEGKRDERVVYRHADQPLTATFRAPSPLRSKGESDGFRVIYFTSPGCSDCARVEEMLNEMQKLFPNMKLQTLNVKKVSAMRTNEALSSRFGVPEGKRLVSPAVFAAGGFLVRRDLVFSDLGDLLARSATMDDGGWGQVATEDLQRADEAIGERYAGMGVGFVLLAGLLDGVNPCAFATIIFLLSYLQLAKRKPREIAQVGGAFILAVFLAYFALGLGLARLIAELTVIRNFGRMLSLAMGALALLIMAANIRDGVLCLRGRLADTALQLPGFLKRRIHATVRVGARHRHFVIAAFVAGIVISFLELACTGQVYLPTILFMLNTGRDVAGAIVFLIVYNLAFIFPLLAVFACAYFGLKSDTLSRLLQRHAAAVKFATAALFLLLFIFFVFGDRFLAVLQ